MSCWQSSLILFPLFCANSLAFLEKKRTGLARDSATLKGYLVTQYPLVYKQGGILPRCKQAQVGKGKYFSG